MWPKIAFFRLPQRLELHKKVPSLTSIRRIIKRIIMAVKKTLYRIIMSDASIRACNPHTSFSLKRSHKRKFFKVQIYFVVTLEDGNPGQFDANCFHFRPSLFYRAKFSREENKSVEFLFFLFLFGQYQCVCPKLGGSYSDFFLLFSSPAFLLPPPSPFFFSPRGKRTTSSKQKINLQNDNVNLIVLVLLLNIFHANIFYW